MGLGKGRERERKGQTERERERGKERMENKGSMMSDGFSSTSCFGGNGLSNPRVTLRMLMLLSLDCSENVFLFKSFLSPTTDQTMVTGSKREKTG